MCIKVQNCINEEIILRIKFANKPYTFTILCFKSKVLSRKTKEKLYTALIKDTLQHMAEIHGLRQKEVVLNFWFPREKFYEKYTV